MFGGHGSLLQILEQFLSGIRARKNNSAVRQALCYITPNGDHGEEF